MTAIVLLLGVASAQDGLFAVDTLRPTVDGALLATETADLPHTWEGRLDAVLAHNPLVAYTVTGAEILVDDTLTLHASAALRLGPARVGLSVPAGVLRQEAEPPRVAAGDPGLSVKLSPWSGRRAGAALVGGLTAPLGGDALWLGGRGLTWEAGLVLDANAGPWRGALNAGLRGQPSTDLVLAGDVEQVALSRQVWARAGLVRALGPVGLSVELVGATGLSPAMDGQTSPLELLVGAHGEDDQGRSWRVGLGAGLLPGVGAPAGRVMVGVGQREGGEAAL